MNEDLAAVRAEIRRSRDVKRKREERHRTLNMTKTTWDTAVCIGLLADFDFRASVAWLKCKQRRGQALPADSDWEALLAALREYFVEADMEHLHALQEKRPLPCPNLCIQWL